MQFNAKTYVLMAGLAVCPATVPILAASGAMPIAQQNALVGTYCAVCHTDAIPNGGLSLQHFDAARPDPGLIAMIVSKLKSKALGASGQPLPDKATQDLFQGTLAVESFGAEKWVIDRQAATVTANVVAAAPSTKSDGEPDLFRLTLTCNTDTHEGGMQLAWSPGVPKSGQAIAALVLDELSAKARAGSLNAAEEVELDSYREPAWGDVIAGAEASPEDRRLPGPVNRELVRRVWKRAGDRCECCMVPQFAFPIPFHIDHIVAEKHGGEAVEENLALACAHCNQFKGPNIAGLDPGTNKLTTLFNPRGDTWADHFQQDGPRLTGKTPIGRTTIKVLAMNADDLLLIRGSCWPRMI